MSSISTHVLNTALGKPAAGLGVTLDIERNGLWEHLADHITSSDGRVQQLLPEASVLQKATYRLTFNIKPYFTAQAIESLYPFVEIAFFVRDPNGHYHIPLLLTANSYSTYRGS